MVIHEYYYNEDNRILYIEFSTKEDSDHFYRVLELGFKDIEYYSPEIIHENDLHTIDEDSIIEIIYQYINENDLPEEKIL